MTVLLNILVNITHSCFPGPTLSVIIIKLMRILCRDLDTSTHIAELAGNDELLFWFYAYRLMPYIRNGYLMP